MMIIHIISFYSCFRHYIIHPPPHGVTTEYFQRILLTAACAMTL